MENFKTETENKREELRILTDLILDFNRIETEEVRKSLEE